MLALAVNGNLDLFIERRAANLNCNGLTKELIDPQSPLIQPWKPSARSWMLYTCSCFTTVSASSFFHCSSDVLSCLSSSLQMGNTSETSLFVSRIPKEHDVFMGSIYTTFCESTCLQVILFIYYLFIYLLAFIYRAVRRDRKVEGERGEMGWGFLHVSFICFWKTFIPFSIKDYI